MPLTREGPPRTMRGVPARFRDTLTAIGTSSARTTARPARASAVIEGCVGAGTACLRKRGQLPVAAPRPVGFRP